MPDPPGDPIEKPQKMTRYDPDTNDPKYGAKIPDSPPPAGKCSDCGARLYPLPDQDPDDIPDRCAGCRGEM